MRAMSHDLYGVLVDSRPMSSYDRGRPAQILRDRFGGPLDGWLASHGEARDRYGSEGVKLDALHRPDSPHDAGRRPLVTSMSPLVDLARQGRTRSS